MQLGSGQPTLIIILLIGASFSCSQVALKRSLGISPSAVTANDASSENISTIETLSMEPAENTSETVSPPANISGSYLVCVEAQAATAESPDAVVNCGLRDNATSRKVDMSAYASKVWTYQLEASSPIAVLMSELTTSLEWHVAITLKGPSLAEVQTAQKSIKFFLSVVDAAGNKFRSMSSVPLSCSGLAGGTWVTVPGDSVYGTKDFCVMKFEAKNEAKNALSQATGLPWMNISQTAALTACQSIGANVHLITNAEWMSLASNIAMVGSNWSGGAVGSGSINSGNSHKNPGAACAASLNDGDGYQQRCAPISVGTWSDKRTHTLSTGAVIWDLAGNAWEWTSYVIANSSAKPYVSTDGSPQDAFRELSAVNADFTAMALHDLRPIHAEKTFWNDVWSSSQGIGSYHAGLNGSGGALFRGAGYDENTNGGIFTARMLGASSYVHENLGFRCVWQPL